MGGTGPAVPSAASFHLGPLWCVGDMEAAPVFWGQLAGVPGVLKPRFPGPGPHSSRGAITSAPALHLSRRTGSCTEAATRGTSVQ